MKICDAASMPYRYVFQLQLFNAWGVGEFLTWNQKENWDAARKAVQQFPRPECYLYEFPEGRKSNDQPFYTLLPIFVLDEIYASETPLPLTTRLHTLDQAHYLTSKNAIGRAFKTALQRSGIAVNGHLSPHDFRDCYRTEATVKGVDYDAAEFALGHAVDPRGYVTLRLTRDEYEKIRVAAKRENMTVEGLVVGWIRWFGDPGRSDSYP